MQSSVNKCKCNPAVSIAAANIQSTKKKKEKQLPCNHIACCLVIFISESCYSHDPNWF